MALVSPSLISNFIRGFNLKIYEQLGIQVPYLKSEPAMKTLPLIFDVSTPQLKLCTFPSER